MTAAEFALLAFLVQLRLAALEVRSFGRFAVRERTASELGARAVLVQLVRVALGLRRVDRFTLTLSSHLETAGLILAADRRQRVGRLVSGQADQRTRLLTFIHAAAPGLRNENELIANLLLTAATLLTDRLHVFVTVLLVHHSNRLAATIANSTENRSRSKACAAFDRRTARPFAGEPLGNRLLLLTFSFRLWLPTQSAQAVLIDATEPGRTYGAPRLDAR